MTIAPDLDYRRKLEELPTQRLFELLQEAEPDTQIDPQNRNRVMRRLEKLHDGDTAGDRHQPRYEVLKLGVTWDRPTLCKRIDERLERRVKEGMIEEVQGLLDNGVSTDFLDRLGLEYRYISRYLLGVGGTREEMLEELSRAIKRFAKRQMTWFRRDAGIHWLNMRGEPEMEAETLIRSFLKQ